jgi:hypothetical protein
VRRLRPQLAAVRGGGRGRALDHGGVGARRGGEHKDDAEQDRPHGDAIGVRSGALVNRAGRTAASRSLADRWTVPIADLAPDRHRPALGRDSLFGVRPRQSGCPAAGDSPDRGHGPDRPFIHCLIAARGNAGFWHLVVLFLGLAGLADGLAPKERRYM